MGGTNGRKTGRKEGGREERKGGKKIRIGRAERKGDIRREIKRRNELFLSYIFNIFTVVSNYDCVIV